MSKDAYSQYVSRKETTIKELKETKKRLYVLGTLRFIVVIATIILAYCFKTAIFPVIIVGIIIFLLLLLYDNKIQKRKVFLETSIKCDEDEIKALNYDFSPFDGASEQSDAAHSYSLDLDIFGENSLFQSLNRTCTNYGRKTLIAYFLQLKNEKKTIVERQNAISELSNKPDFLHKFRIIGLINTGKITDYQEIKQFVNSPNLISGTKVWKCLAIVFPSLWIIGITLVALGLIPGLSLVSLYLITLFISESQAKRVNALAELSGKKVKVLQAYADLIQLTESETFHSSKLQEYQSVFKNENRKASMVFKKFAQLTGELEQRANLVVHIIFNPLILWDIKKAIQLEEFKQRNSESLMQWIEVLGKFDAFCSLGTFSYNHQDYIYPNITDDYFQIDGEALGHPLMKKEACVCNDIKIETNPYFLIITGANMAGKSTYLRTIGVNYILACIGAPVFAKSLTLFPASLVTSLRTSDSLLSNESYFFAELKRLKMIIDRLEAGEKMFIILDEILKGTNSVDKQNGSLALVRQFVRLNSCGIIATHDLLLGNLEKEFPCNVKNYRFEADIKNNELSFSYLLREGLAQNMNASFLMKKMGITL